MNFEFMKDLDIVHPMYRYCANAEDLAKSMPDNSMFTSRKSAEALAKLIYRIAHDEEAKQIDFVDILNDPVVRKYVSDPTVINAFHFIRKKGNEAVHTMTEENEETAVSVLRNLHYVFGETAKKIGLISEYPIFNPDIKKNVEAVPLNIDDLDEVSRKMFKDYVVNQNKVDSIFSELIDMMAPITITPSYMDINEMLIFDHKPVNPNTIALIQRHFLTLALCAQKEAQSEEEKGINSSFRATLTINGNKSYTTSDLGKVIYGIRYDLPNADGFTIDSSYYGGNPCVMDNPRPDLPAIVNPYLLFNPLHFETLPDKLAKTEKFDYKTFSHFANGGENLMRSFKAGKEVALTDNCTTDILDRQYDNGKWYNDNCSLGIYGDFPNHPEILAALKDAARKVIPDYQLEFAEDLWEEDDECLFTIAAQFVCTSLRKMQDFFDEINAILAPVLGDDFGGDSDYCWYLTTAPYGIAYLYWTEQGFIIKGKEL